MQKIAAYANQLKRTFFMTKAVFVSRVINILCEGNVLFS